MPKYSARRNAVYFLTVATAAVSLAVVAVGAAVELVTSVTTTALVMVAALVVVGTHRPPAAAASVGGSGGKTAVPPGSPTLQGATAAGVVGSGSVFEGLSAVTRGARGTVLRGQRVQIDGEFHTYQCVLRLPSIFLGF